MCRIIKIFRNSYILLSFQCLGVLERKSQLTIIMLFNTYSMSHVQGNQVLSINSSLQNGASEAISGDQAANEMLVSHSDSSSLTQAPNIAQFLKKFTTFCYQIANGMVSVGH